MENQSETPIKKKIQKHTLQENFRIFGNKGNVWSDECHIAKSDLSGRTLCSTPMLSTNWARIENVQTIGCQECIELYLAYFKK